MPDVEFGCLPTVIGSMPHTDPTAACLMLTRYLKEIPAWPQLPRRSFLENMYIQFSEGFPGVVVKGDSIYVDRSQELGKPLEQLYAAYLESDVDRYAISPDYAAGLYCFLSLDNLAPVAVKGQITGPITWAGTVADNNKQAIIHDDTLTDAAAKFLKLKAAWQEKALSEISKNTIIFVDEPYMAAYGASTSSGVLTSTEKIVSLLGEVFSGITGLKGIHCCGNTDWSVLLKTRVDIISFDTYNYAQSLSLYPAEIKEFLDGKGAIAWGIVPNDEESLVRESVASLKDRLEEAMAPFTRKGIPFRQLLEQGLLTPSCGLASMATEEAAARVLELLAGLSEMIRKRYL